MSSNVAVGVAKQLRYKKEVTWGTAPGTGSAQLLRRVTSMIDVQKDTYKSNEIRSSYQVADYRHGVRRVKGAIKGELSAGTWKDFIAAACRQAYAALTATTGVAITIAGSGPTYTVTRGTGSWLTDGYKAGDVGRLSAGAFNAANISKNLYVVAVTSATVLTVQPLNGVALVAEGPIATSTFTLTGKKTYIPITSQTDDSFAIEHWHSDASLSELYTGCKVESLGISLPPTGLSTIDLSILGKDVTTAGSAYYVTPTVETGFRDFAAVNGLLFVQGVAVALLTGLSFTIKGNMSGEPVVGSNVLPDIIEGRVDVDGTMSVLLFDGTYRDYFLNETEVAVSVVLTADSTATSDFIAINMPRVKVGGANKDDGEKGLIQTLPFVALQNTAGGTGIASENTTISFQDTQA